MGMTKVPVSKLRFALLIITLGLLAGACATPTPRPAASWPVSAPHSSYDARVEQVFLYQSRIANELLDRYPFEESFNTDADPVLRAAEARMTARCGFVSQVALMRLEAQEPSLALKLKVLVTVNSCEAAAHEVAGLLTRGNATMASAELAAH